MATTTSKLDIAYLDFDQVKVSLRDFLRSQDVFRDYDFTGSGLNILLDTLAYNTHYLGFYLNLIANEMFLDSAAIRSSVVSLAKHLNYTPRSTTASKAIISIVATPNDGATSMTILKNTPFVTKLDNVNYTFLTDKSYTANLVNGVFTFPSVTLIEGQFLTYQYTVDGTIPNQRFLIPNASADTSTVSVIVQQSITNTTFQTYTLVDNFLQLKSDTPAFFLQEVEDGLFEVYFGDGITGQSLIDGNIVILTYMVCHGALANGSTSFTPAGLVGGYPTAQLTIQNLAISAGGDDPETIEQIKFAAPKNFEVQGRAVTSNDYKFIISENYQNIDSVAVWGGEDSVPPQYGKVFISIKPVNGFVITQSVKDLITQDILRTRNVVAVIPQIIDPDFTYIIVNSIVKYNPTSTFRTAGDLQTTAYNAILNFASVELNKFDLSLKYSRLLSSIDSSDSSISNNLTTLQMKKIFTPQLEVSSNYKFNLNNAVVPGTLTSTSFIAAHDTAFSVPYSSGKTYTIGDDAKGNLTIIQAGLGLPLQIVRNCGTINYETGVINIQQLIPTQADANGNISLTMTPQESDITPIQNNILVMQPQDITVTVTPVVPKS